MSISGTDVATGFAQEIPGGWVFELGNRWMLRRIHCISGRIATTSLVNNVNVEEYLEQPNAEFEIELRGEGQKVTLDSREFTFKEFHTPQWDDSKRTLQIVLETQLNDVPFQASVFYEASAAENFLRKWISIEPCELEGWAIAGVTIENMRLKELVEGVAPQMRYPHTYPNHEDNVHDEPDKVNATEPSKRFMFGDLSRAVVSYWGYGEGLFFFTQSLLGEEEFYRPKGLAMRQRDWAPLTEGLTTGPAIIGAYSGPPEVGFKAYTRHLMDHWCVVNSKTQPVAWNTWLITLPGGRPLQHGFDRNMLVEQIDRMRQAGFYDILRLDFGWEGEKPLHPDAGKFPKGLGEIVRRAKDAAELDMAYWMNPFSSNYRHYSTETEQPQNLVPDKVSSRSGAPAMCAATGYADEVEERLVELVTTFNARMVYWDGADWNITECTARGHGHRDPDELRVKAWERLAGICDAAHAAREDLIIAAFSLPFDNHRLCALDQEQVADTYQFPMVRSELIQRQQLYQMTFEHPYKAIYGSWYGVGWHEAGEGELAQRPMRELRHACMSMIGNGLVQAGGSIDLGSAPEELTKFLTRLFAFRKRYAQYFESYQHVLGFPDGEHTDGEGHIIDGAGFIVLINPTQIEQTVKIPLNEPELELDPSRKHVLTDWTSLERGSPVGSFKPASAPEIDLAPLEVRYVGINVG